MPGDRRFGRKRAAGSAPKPVPGSPADPCGNPPVPGRARRLSGHAAHARAFSASYRNRERFPTITVRRHPVFRVLPSARVRPFSPPVAPRPGAVPHAAAGGYPDAPVDAPACPRRGPRGSGRSGGAPAKTGGGEDVLTDGARAAVPGEPQARAHVAAYGGGPPPSGGGFGGAGLRPRSDRHPVTGVGARGAPGQPGGPCGQRPAPARGAPHPGRAAGIRAAFR